MEKLCLVSGDCFEGVCGTETPIKYYNGEMAKIGDVITMWHTDWGEWWPSDHLTSVVDARFTTYQGGEIKLEKPNKEPFVMGIANVDLTKEDCKWRIVKLKDWTEAVEGEQLGSARMKYTMMVPPAAAVKE